MSRRSLRLFRQLVSLLFGIVISIIIVGERGDVWAANPAFVTIVNPVRGEDFWGLNDQPPLTAVKEQLSIIQENNLAATWLLRPDALFDRQISSFFKNLPPNQEGGIFLEVTPRWAKEAGVNYHQGVLWHYANSIFLSGYTLEERKKLIDSAFQEFNKIFGSYPQSVGAWHIDARSLEYMNKRYKVRAALICADQFLTDDYQIWGSWWGVPYYPSRFNILIPAQTRQNKLEVVILWWAARDPIRGYSGGTEESTFSLQANDYLRHGLGSDYFSSLVDVYLKAARGNFGQVTVGLENDNPWPIVGEEYRKEMEIIREKNPRVVTMREFASWYRQEIPGLSPSHRIETGDLLGEDSRATWLMDNRGRIGILEKEGKKIIRDLRIYNEQWPEPFLEVANQKNKLNLSLPAKVDTVRFPSSAIPLKTDPRDYLREKLDLPFAAPKTVFFLMGIISFLLLFSALKLDRWLFPLVGLGALSQTMTMIKSGLLFPYGMGFWGPNGHDGIWHIALIEEITRHFPPQNPVFATFPLTNYHWLFDLGVALLQKITGIPVINLYFQIIPLVFSGLLGILTYIFLKKWTSNRLCALIGVLFAYFGGSFGWLVTFWRSRDLGGESLFWANQAISFLINPPFAFSILGILLGLIVFLDYLDKPEHKKFIFLTVIFGLLIGIKAYGGVVVISGLLMAAVWGQLTGRFRVIFPLSLSTILLSGLVFWLTGNHPPPIFISPETNLFIFSPFWFSRTMLAFSDRFFWPQLEQARQVYFTEGNWLCWFLAEFLAVLIFFVGNLGTRILFLGGLREIFSRRREGKLAPFFLGSLLASGILPMIFIQKGNPWNSIQFFYYFLFFAGLLAAAFLGKFLGKRRVVIRISLIGFLVFLTIPTTVGSLPQYLPYRAPSRIGYEELEALQFLKRLPGGIVLSFPHDYRAREKTEAPRPVFAYETTAYISALSSKPTYLEDEMNLEIMRVNWESRREAVEKFFTTTDPTWAREFLKTNKIRYLYFLEGQSFFADPAQLELEKIFENGQARIYEFRGKI